MSPLGVHFSPFLSGLPARSLCVTERVHRPHLFTLLLMVPLRIYSLLLITPWGTEIPFELSHIRVKRSVLFAGQLWEPLELSLYAGVALLNPCNSAPLLKMQQLVAIQDAAVYAVPHTYSVVFRAWYKLCYRYVTATRKDGEEFDNRVTLLAFRASSLLWLR